jgi:N-acetylneuraminate synthase
MNKVCIIAEAGVNHNGDIELAKEMIIKAKEAKADYIKFQTFSADELVLPDTEKANYQTVNDKIKESQFMMLKRLELSKQDFVELKGVCDRIQIGFLSTPFDISSIDFLEKMKLDFWKVPSGEITNYPYLKKIALTGKKVVMSTGMSSLEEIEQAIEVLRSNGSSDIVIMHCTTEYPTPFQDANLYAIKTLQKKFACKVGYSDHTLGIEASIAAVALGATIIEKHFTLNKNMQGPDHSASLEPKELNNLVNSVRNIEIAMGNGVKKATTSEIENKEIIRKSIVAKININKDEIFSEQNLTVKRPAKGLSPMRWNEIIGNKADRDYKKDEMIGI